MGTVTFIIQPAAGRGQEVQCKNFPVSQGNSLPVSNNKDMSAASSLNRLDNNTLLRAAVVR